MSRSIRIVSVAVLLLACEPEAPAPSAEAPPATADEPSGDVSEALHLEVPPAAIARARQEAAGLYRMPRGLRAQTLARRRSDPQPSYAELRADADAHADASVSFEGRVGLVRSAGPRLWILALHTRQDGERWTDPLYVLSVIPTMLPVDGGAIARVDGWVVGSRRIGRHRLPLIVTYYTERTDEAAGAEPAAPSP